MKKLIGLLIGFIFMVTSAYAMDVTLQWDAPEHLDVTSYRIYYDIDSGPPYDGTGAAEGDSGLERLLVNNESFDSAVVEYTLTGLPDDAVFYFAVKAVDNLGLTSGYSNEVNTEGPPEPEISIKEIIFSQTQTQTQTQKITLKMGD